MGIRKTIILLTLLLLAGTASAQVLVKGVRMWPEPGQTRLVFDISGPIEHSLFTLRNPDRIVVDLRNTKLATNVDHLNFAHGLIKDIRHAPRNGKDLRIVLDLKSAVQPKSYVLRPNSQYGNRLVLDLVDPKGDGSQAPAPVVKRIDNTHRDIVIAIDAGHGGEDPGATGPHHIHEKDVTLAIARKLRDMVAKEYGMRPVMTRNGDYYVSLAERVKKARAARADFFVSIHADAFPNPSARGASVYVLSRSGASSEHAKLLADKENASDLIGGVSLDDKDDLVASVLLDLSMTASTEASTDVASRVLHDLRHVGPLHRRRVERAGFRVLKSPDLPSILVETAFITNPREEERLDNSHHQRQIAAAILDGIRSYFHQYPPPDTLLAAAKRTHVIARGETLSQIAHDYQVSLNTLRNLNDLNGNMLRVGDVLRIPPPRSSGS